MCACMLIHACLQHIVLCVCISAFVHLVVRMLVHVFMLDCGACLSMLVQMY